jgi:cystathionine gamma-synthase
MSEDGMPWSARTRLAQALGAMDAATGAVIPPVHLTTTYARNPDHDYPSPFTYGRPDNPTVQQVEALVASLEGAASAMLFGSGMSAAVALFLTLSRGDHVVVPSIMYWGLRNWLHGEGKRLGLDVTSVDMTDVGAVEAALKPGRTRLVWIETPANPTWDVTDIAAVARLAHAAGARVTVDSTCATPIFTQPLSLGADLVMHSATKYLNGHSDVIAGVLCCAAPDAMWDHAVRLRASNGMILGPFEAYLLMRGLRTLDLRVRAAAASALDLAQRFETHPQVEAVLYPGLPSHPQHDVALRQMVGGFGAMLSIRVKGGAAAAIACLAHLRLWKRATSLGGVESLIEHRASVEGPSSPCPPDLLRLSVGLESPDDLFADLDAALRRSGTVA